MKDSANSASVVLKNTVLPPQSVQNKVVVNQLQPVALTLSTGFVLVGSTILFFRKTLVPWILQLL